MAKTDWTLDDEVQPTDMNDIGEEINQLRTDLDNIDIPLASLTQAGIVQLSNATDSTDEDKAATPKAVKTVEDDLNSHTSLFSAHGATSSATASRIIMRDSAGRAKIAAPSASDDIARKDTVDNAVGNLSNLMTSAKSNAVAAINELFTSASNGKTQIAAAITGKGVPASGSDTFAQLASKIDQIPVGKKYFMNTYDGNGAPISVNFGFGAKIVLITWSINSSWTIARPTYNGSSFEYYGVGGINTLDSSKVTISGNTITGITNFFATSGVTHRIQAWE